ncbi:HK97 gp10 family phage protein [Paenibacillus sp. FSL R7-0128]|uniref:HK97 gp10 family phage protein n=1 Tax=Paenibacillus sp. FSL R7-0128 TaxID=2954529 RepID=UPI0030FB5339
MTFEVKVTELHRFLEAKRGAMIEAAVAGLHDATDLLLAKSREVAPLDTGTLRITAGKKVTVEGSKAYGEVFYSATEEGASGVRFNYALRVHEMGRYKNPTTPGTRPKFLSQPLKTNKRLYMQVINDAVRRAMG